MDIVTQEQRSRMMSGIRSKDTKPERIVRSTLHRMGYRFRLHRRDLPGRPDMVLPRHQTVLFVHGCFWHRHPGCKFAYSPKTRTAFWENKFAQNVKRDRAAIRKLRRSGWRVIVIWECKTRDLMALTQHLRSRLEPGKDDKQA